MPETPLQSAGAAIQVLPEGLLGFLQLKNGGKFPQHLGSQELRPQIELLNWYLETNAETVGQTAVAGAAGTVSFNSLVVPVGEWWYVSHYRIVAVATDITGAFNSIPIAVFPVFSNPFKLASVYVGLGAGTAGNTVILGMSSRQGFWLPPNGGLGIHTSQSSFAAAVTFEPAARITRLPI